MNKSMNKVLVAVSFVTGVAVLSGCQTRPENDVAVEVAQVRAFARASAAAGAREDATLEKCHFTGPALNSLGEQKLDLMVPDGDGAEPSAKPMTVYLDVAADDANKGAYQDAVVKYLADKGITESDLKFALGPNPSTLHPAAKNGAQLDKLDKLETQDNSTKFNLNMPVSDSK
jgi:hypothetical protein